MKLIRVICMSVMVLIFLTGLTAQTAGSTGSAGVSGSGAPLSSQPLNSGGQTQSPLPSGQAAGSGSVREAEAGPELEALLKEYSEKPSPRRAAELGSAYYQTGDFASAAAYFRQAAESFRRTKDRARAYYNAGTAVIEANREAMQNATAAAAAGRQDAADSSTGGPPPIQTAIDYLHRSLDLEPGRADGARNMEIAKLLQAQQEESRQEQEEQNGEESQEDSEKQDGDEDSQDGDEGDSGEKRQEEGEPQTGDQDSQSGQGESGEEQEGTSGQAEPSDEEENPEEHAGASEEGETDEEDIQERLSEILGNEEENRQLREALLEKRGGISEVERDW